MAEDIRWRPRAGIQILSIPAPVPTRGPVSYYLLCRVCGVRFQTTSPVAAMCSGTCRTRRWRQLGRHLVAMQCEWCQAPYTADAGNPARHCSRKCGAQHRHANAAGKQLVQRACTWCGALFTTSASPARARANCSSSHAAKARVRARAARTPPD